MTLFDFLEKHYLDLVLLVIAALMIWSSKGGSK